MVSKKVEAATVQIIAEHGGTSPRSTIEGRNVNDKRSKMPSTRKPWGWHTRYRGQDVVKVFTDEPCPRCNGESYDELYPGRSFFRPVCSLCGGQGKAWHMESIKPNTGDLKMMDAQERFEADIKANEERNKAAYALNEFLANGGDMFSDKGLDLQQVSLKGVEFTAVRAMMLVGKTEFQQKVDDTSVIEDAFNQGVNLLRLVQHQTALLVLLKSAELFKEGEPLDAVKGLACQNQVDIIDHEMGLCQLMRSIIYTINSKKEQLNG